MSAAARTTLLLLAILAGATLAAVMSLPAAAS